MSKYVLLLVISQFCLGLSYKIPNPSIQVYRPRGIKMTVPDDEGIELVAFHVNVNKPIENQEGDYTKYIVHPLNGKWIYEHRVVRLRPGDTVYYWLYVQRDGVGYRHSRGQYVVTEYANDPQPCSLGTCSGNVPNTPSTTENYNVKPSPTRTVYTTSTVSAECNLLIETLVERSFRLENELQQIKDENQILKEMLEGGEHQLELTGSITNTGEPLGTVVFVLREKMDVVPSIKYARKAGVDTILFGVETLEDQLNIILSAKRDQNKRISIRPVKCKNANECSVYR